MSIIIPTGRDRWTEWNAKDAPGHERASDYRGRHARLHCITKIEAGIATNHGGESFPIESLVPHEEPIVSWPYSGMTVRETNTQKGRAIIRARLAV